MRLTIGLVRILLFCAVLLALPAITTAQPAQDTTQRRIEELEQWVRDHPGVFDWNVHNELRHLYSIKNPPDLRKSMEHSNVSLQHSVMDEYILNILSGWQIGKDTPAARANLLMNAQAFPDLRFIAAACFLKIGDLYTAEGNLQEAKSFYLKVAEDNSPDMAQYRILAEKGLSQPPTIPPSAGTLPAPSPPTIPPSAGTSPDCSPNLVTASFAQAAQSRTLEMWETSYATSTCPAQIKNGASAMAAAYIAMNATMLPFASPSNPSVLNPMFAWEPGGAAGNDYKLSAGELALTAGAESHQHTPPMVIYPFEGDFQVSVKVVFQTDGPDNQGAGIGLRAPQDRTAGDWVSILSQFSYGKQQIWSGLFSYVKDFGRVDYTNSVVYLRVTKQGALVRTEYSANGTNWVLIKDDVHSLQNKVEIFLYAFSTNSEGVLARFSEFSIVALNSLGFTE